jgi:multidrug transporter EmrE-like cation transporter
MNGLTLAQIALCTSFAVFMAVGQVLFKTVAVKSNALTSAQSLFGMLLIPQFWLALLLYGLATLLWIRILQEVPLSRAYPFAALGFVLVPAASVLFFGETISKTYILGAVFIISGILVVARG